MMSIDQIKALADARKQVSDLEAEMLEDIRERAAALGMTVAEAGPTAPKQKRKRRSKAEIEADNAKASA